MLLCVAITVCVVAWGYLVFAAIDFGSTARGGDQRAWAFLALACLGAAACLFAGMILVGRLLRTVGVIADHEQPPVEVHAEVRAGAGSQSGIPPEPRTSSNSPIEDTAPISVVPAPRTQGGKRAAR